MNWIHAFNDGVDDSMNGLVRYLYDVATSVEIVFVVLGFFGCLCMLYGILLLRKP